MNLVEIFPLSLGSLAEWLSAFASIIAVGYAIQANRIAANANTLVHVIEEKRQAMQRTQDKRLEEYEASRRMLEEQKCAANLRKEKRTLAGTLQVWWVMFADKSKHRYGWILLNKGAGACVFRDVEKTHRSKLGSDSKRIKIVPPGQYFLENTNGSFLEPAPNLNDYEPLCLSSEYDVERVTYTDSLGECWLWVAGTGLEEISETALINP